MTTATRIDDETLEGHETTAALALSRISVARPYFALDDLEVLGGGAASATISRTEPTWPEAGPIEAAQVARHLAILGSCAAAFARDDDSRNHYLATKAHYTRLAGGPTTWSDEPMRAEAFATWLDKRTARAYIKLSTLDGQGSHLLDVHYSVLAPKMFKRLHPPAETIIDLEPSMHIDGAIDCGLNMSSDAIEDHGDGVRVDCGPILASACAGHFPDYPAAPVAILMGRLCRAAGVALGRKLAPDREAAAEIGYVIEAGEVSASKLARAGQRLVLEASYSHEVEAGHVMRGSAFADDELVGEVTVTMSTAESATGLG